MSLTVTELLPNKFRHIGICLSDGFVFLIVIIGPIVGRVSDVLEKTARNS
jgi:hypothetical protein